MATAMMGLIMNLELMAGEKGRVGPPTMASVSMAAGATAVMRELWIILEDFLRAYEEMLRTADMNDSPHVRLLPLSIPSFLIFSMMRGVLISKYSSILYRRSCVLSICSSHSEAEFNRFSI